MARLTAIILSIIVFWFGLKNSSIDKVNLEEGNYNTPFIRLVCLGSILALEASMMWNFILFQCKKIRENSKSSTKASISKVPPKKTKAKEESDTEVDRDLKSSSQTVQDSPKKSN